MPTHNCGGQNRVKLNYGKRLGRDHINVSGEISAGIFQTCTTGTVVLYDAPSDDRELHVTTA
jgi:hypothetical protein